MRSRAGVALLVAVASAGCGGGGPPRIDRDDSRSSDVFELRTTVGGALRALGTAREWYSPRNRLFRVEHPTEDESFRMTYDGRAVTRRVRAGVVRVTASHTRAMRDFTEQLSIFEAPGIYVTKLYLRQLPPDESVRVRAVDGGRELRATWLGENKTRVPIRVEILSRRSLDRRVFRLFRGKLAGAVRQVPPGARPLYGEHAWWFGPRLANARAVMTIERFGLDPWVDEQDYPDGYEYETVYRLPRSALPPGLRPAPDRTYPGFGPYSALQVRVVCNDGRRPPPFGVELGTRPERLRLETGERATLYVNASGRAGEGVTASILVGQTTCFVDGMIAPHEFRRLAPTLRRPR